MDEINRQIYPKTPRLVNSLLLEHNAISSPFHLKQLKNLVKCYPIA